MPNVTRPKVAVLLSGGVDSSVALSLLHAENRYDLCAFYLKIWLEDELAYLGDCPWEDDLRYAREVTDSLGIPLKVIPMQSEYLSKVVAEALTELRQGHTPSPDIWCNERIKFGSFVDVIGPEYEKIASGHYAQVEAIDSAIDSSISPKFYLKQAPDPIKDQTYFLSRLSQAQLSRILFPIGHMSKQEVRAKAQELNLATQSRKDSQGICFLGKIHYRDFVKFHLGEKKGEIKDINSGKILGTHQGVWFHTVGQRQGLGLGGGPWYVAKKALNENILYVSHGDDLQTVSRTRFEVAEFHWIPEIPSSLKEFYDIKLRHGPHCVRAKLKEICDGRFEIELVEGDPGVAPGQSAIIYDGPYCLGGGYII